jgi:hypothetical protein
VYETKFHIHTKQQAKWSSFFYILIFKYLDRRPEGNTYWTVYMAASVPQIKSAVLICFRRTQTFELCRIFRRLVTFLHILILSCSVVTRHEHVSLLLDQLLIKILCFSLRCFHPVI